jgi:hypothetical protein
LPAEILVGTMTWYAAAGVVFAIVFVARGVSRVDEHAAGAGLGFRMIIFPGVVALWPFLLSRWMRARS